MRADSWSSKDSHSRRTRRSIRSIYRGSLDGRVGAASPTPTRRRQAQEPEEETTVWVGPSEPEEAPTGKLWFDTDAFCSGEESGGGSGGSGSGSGGYGSGS